MMQRRGVDRASYLEIKVFGVLHEKKMGQYMRNMGRDRTEDVR